MEQQNRAVKNHRLDSLVFLRGVAILMVLFCHFGGALKQINQKSLYDSFHDFGRFGVQMFFIISGFVIPLSLDKGRYQLSDYGRFLYKRFLRLQLPYTIGVLITFGLVYLSYKYRHEVFPENTITFLETFFYLHAPADNPVFWTLQVEVQYYFFIGLLFPLLLKYRKLSILLILLLSVLNQIEFFQQILFITYLPFFCIGITCYVIYTSQHSFIPYVAVLPFLLLTILYKFTLIETGLSIATLAIILFYKKGIPQWLHFPGEVSYSVYLIHFPIGIKFLNLMKTKINSNYYPFLFLAAIVIVFAAGWILYKLFEKPSEIMSKKIKYTGAKHGESNDVRILSTESTEHRAIQ